MAYVLRRDDGTACVRFVADGGISVSVEVGATSVANGPGAGNGAGRAS
jgi:hypothetical protein